MVRLGSYAEEQLQDTNTKQVKSEGIRNFSEKEAKILKVAEVLHNVFKDRQRMHFKKYIYNMYKHWIRIKIDQIKIFRRIKIYYKSILIKIINAIILQSNRDGNRL